MLCVVCQIIFRTEAIVQDNGSWASSWTTSSTVQTLTDRSAGCFICRNIRTRLGVSETGAFTADKTSLRLDYILRKPASLVGLYEFRVGLGLAATGQRLDIIPFLLESVHAGPLIGSVTSKNTGSSDSLDFLKRCIQTCQAEHQLCRATAAGQNWHPTRLVEVSDHDVRLILTNETLPDGPYVSLSHRWGNTYVKTLTVESINAMREQIDPVELPVTFQQAFSVMRYLGFRYIWIDSLCIVQNDGGEDWAREAGQMKLVYQNASMNLAATQSEDSSTGLFANRDPDFMHSGIFHVDNGVLEGEFRSVYSALELRYGWQSEVEQAPLNNRGWVLQERLLSPRVVHFTRHQIYWDCAETTVCETVPSGALIWPQMESGLFGTKKGSGRLLESPSREEDTRLGLWATIVSTYSKCQLTFNSDKFSAVSGLAQYVGQLLKGNTSYVAGLWSAQPEIQLCWLVERTPDYNLVTRNGLAPSWSWASVNGPVDTPRLYLYEGESVKLLVKVLDITAQQQTVTRHDGGNGGVSYSGRVELQCVLHPVSLEGTRGGDYNARLAGHGMEHCIRVDLDTEDVLEEDGELYLVPLFESQSVHPADPSKVFSTEVRGIIVKVEDRATGTYSRRGHVMLTGRTDPATGKFPAALLDVLSSRGKGDLPQMVTEAGEAGHHVICIV